MCSESKRETNRAQRGLELLGRDRRHGEIMVQALRDFDQGRLDEADARIRTVLAENPGFGAAISLRAKIDTARGPRNVTPRLKTRDNRSVVLQFRDASTKMVFEVLARQTGINFIFDKDIKSDGKTTIFVQNVPVEQAIDLVLGQNQLARQILSDNMVLIYPNTPAKQNEYQDQIVRTFYLTNTEPKRADGNAQDHAECEDAVRRRARRCNRDSRHAGSGSHGGAPDRFHRRAGIRGHDGSRSARAHPHPDAGTRHQVSAACDAGSDPACGRTAGAGGPETAGFHDNHRELDFGHY